MSATVSQCPYCNNPKSRFLYRMVDIEPGLSQHVDLLHSVEIYCAHCKRTISITPFI